MAAVMQPAGVTLADCRTGLVAYLRALWNVTPALVEQAPDDDGAVARPFLVDAALHLPKQLAGTDATRAWYRAAAAHATAHRVYSCEPLDLHGLPPISQALLALLEDARVECLASRELPGLRRLWSAWHTATPELGDGFEALLQRLARALIEPAYADPHPWIAKGRELFFLDASTQVMALRQPAELRRAATLLGNDIGQMRLPFNAKRYRVEPSYRDDHRWMQPPQPAASTGEAPLDAAAVIDADEVPIEPQATSRHAEWDWRIARYRRDWCTVREADARPADPRLLREAMVRAGPLLVPMLRALQASRRTRLQGRARERSGPAFDLPGLVRDRVAHRLGRPGEERVHRRWQRSRARGSTLLLIDLSASTSRAGADGGDLLGTMRLAAALLAQALHQAGEACAVLGFRSAGRHAVQLRRVKDFHAAPDDDMLARLAGLGSRLSTRLGAALRHASGLLAARPAPRTLLLITDGRPHDIDLHDPRYLVEDARQAVQEARRRGIETRCIDLDPASLPVACRVFGPRGVAGLKTPGSLPSAIALLGL